MPILAQIICDGCQTVKKETNHWYTLVINARHEACIRPMAYTPPSLLQLGVSHVSYFCGMRCAIDGITQWMDQLASAPKQIAEAAATESFASEVTGHAVTTAESRVHITWRAWQGTCVIT